MADERALGHGERNSHPARAGHAHHRTKGAHFSIAYNERAACLWRGNRRGYGMPLVFGEFRRPLFINRQMFAPVTGVSRIPPVFA